MQRALFGVAVPEYAVRVVIRPVLGRGGALPLFEAPLSEGNIPADTDVQVAASRNGPFWEYIDAAVKQKRIEAQPDGWEWKLRISFFNQLGAEESFTTASAFEFYRSGAASKGEESGLEARVAALFERGFAVLQELGRQQAKALKRVHKASADSLAQITAASASALGEVTKQTAVVTEITKALHEETIELKKIAFKLGSERAKAEEQPKSTADQIKDVVNTVQTLSSLADTLGGSSPSPNSPPAAPSASNSGAS